MDAPSATAPGGANQRPLIARPGDERYPTFSPAGSKIAFRGDADGIAPSGDEEIFVADADGTDVVQLTRDSAIDSAPAWSPDGRRLAWESTRDATEREIHVMDADGSDVRRLTTNAVHDEGPAWSPDGRYITFTRSPTAAEPGDVWVMRSDGTRERKLTDTPLIEESPDWQPLPITVGPADASRGRCSATSLAARGVSTIVAVGTSCRRAHPIVTAWLRRQPADRRTVVRGSYTCEQDLHSFDQTVVQCEHAGGRRGVAFVYRRPVQGAVAPSAAR